MPAPGAYRKGALHPTKEPPLPSNFTGLGAIIDADSAVGSMVNVMGLVADYQLPIPTKSKDHKCTLKLYDLSIENAGHGISFNIFRPAADMPQVKAADVVVLTNAKVQRYRRADPISLITHWRTSVRVYSAAQIPRPPESAQAALVPSTSKFDKHTPSAHEHLYVSHLYHKFDKGALPDEEVFMERAARSLNVKDKFSLLQDVHEGMFCDLIAQVSREPHALADMATLYVSDYTENAAFHSHTWEGLDESGSGGGDPYNYTSGSPIIPRKEWAGPYGKMSIQVTVYEPHASIVRSEVSAGQWVSLRNVQIKYGRDGRYLEGFLREDRNSTATRIEVFGPQDRETIDPHLKDAVRRCRDYGKNKKSQIQDIKSAQVAGQKRRASGPAEEEQQPLTTKERRRRKRLAQEQKEKEDRSNKELRLSLNDQIACEVHSAPFSTIESILEPVLCKTTVGGQDATLAAPFICAKYRAHVRVVDFHPRALEDFACSRKTSLFDIFSDSEDDVSSSDDAAPGTNRVWEWRFALQLEDPTPQPRTKNPAPRPRVWVLVNNTEAQCLTGLDATDLRQDPATLTALRQRLFILWGELEERKARVAERERERRRAEKGKGRQRHAGLEKPPLESSNVEDGGRDKEKPVANKPFPCCIQQYGVYNKAAEEWVRCYGLFGTKICD
ncbi:hypothetical protein BT67DRAFT_370973 [Trichocladium antarcticum]|uniref:Protection of telomeres protein 1 n=1 Tax=Trichocladium antarcticum TaxID=1450529 RepID=A0AAN6US99_9PEZI|nr:hypothetical protein BT67DRAFT_370973 [Trichocladium antarcticum]